MLREGTYSMAAASNQAGRAAQYKAFFDDVLSKIFDFIYEYDAENDRHFYWLDDSKTVGFAAITYSSSGNTIAAAYKSGNNLNTRYDKSSTCSSELTFYYQISKNKNTLFLWEFGSSTSYQNFYIAAKDENNKWHIFYSSYVVGEAEGRTNSDNYCSVSENALGFTAVPMVTPDGAKCPELCKILYAPSFVEHNMLIKFGDEIHRAVPVYYSNAYYPSFTFPVSED